MEINNKHRDANWKQVAMEFQSERDALQKEVFRLREQVALLEEEINHVWEYTSGD